MTLRQRAVAIVRSVRAWIADAFRLATQDLAALGNALVQGRWLLSLVLVLSFFALMAFNTIAYLDSIDHTMARVERSIDELELRRDLIWTRLELRTKERELREKDEELVELRRINAQVLYDLAADPKLHDVLWRTIKEHDVWLHRHDNEEKK